MAPDEPRLLTSSGGRLGAGSDRARPSLRYGDFHLLALFAAWEVIARGA
jgi:hypothetical protein